MRKNIVAIIGVGVAVLLAVILILVLVAQQSPGENTGGQRAGLQEFVDGIQAGSVGTKWVSATMPANTNSVAIYTNRTGRDVYADFGAMDIPTGQTASTTVLGSLFATSSSATSVPTWADFGTLAEGKRALIQADIIATSTTASSTNSVMASVLGKGAGSVVVPDGSTLFGYIQNRYTVACTGSQCETATSSNRGYNPVFKVRITTYGKSF